LERDLSSTEIEQMIVMKYVQFNPFFENTYI